MEGFRKKTIWYDMARPLCLLGLALFLATSLFSFASSSVSAASVTVTNTNDSGAGSLRQAIVDANATDTIVFDGALAGQTITLASELAVNKALTIDGSSTPNMMVSGGHSVRVINATAPLTLIGFTVANGQAPSPQVGGGILTSNALTLTLMHIANNQASSGGGIQASSGSVVVINRSTLSGNHALAAGGGLFGQGNSVTILNSAIYSNTTAEDGGGLLIDSGSLLIENSTVSGNEATLTGGGVWASITGATIRYSTLANNRAGGSGGGLYVRSGGNVALDSTVIADSQNGGDCVGTVSGPGYNLIEDATNACSLTNGQNNNFIGADPALGALGDYGGPTWTHFNDHTGNLSDHGNPATCPATDQRGSARPNGSGCDIGAVESDLPPTFNTANPANGATGVPVNGNLSFQFSEAVTAPDAAFSLQCPAGTPIAFGVSGSGSNTVTLDPTNDLPASVTCTWAIVGSQVTDVDNNDPPDSLTTSPGGSFTTATAVDTAPAVTGVTPANGATGVAVNSNIVFTFSEPVTGPTSGFRIECPTGTPIAFTDLGANTATRTLFPSSALPANTTCQVTLQADAISDMDNNDPPDHLASNYTTSFTTAAPADTAPAVTDVTPANGATGVAVNSNIVFTFSEPVTGPTSGFRIECPTGTPIAFTDLGANTATRTLFPSSALPANTTCQVTLQADAISDIDNNDPPDHLASNYTTSFTTVGPVVGQPPSIYGTPLDQAVVGQPYRFDAQALDNANATLIFSIQNKPDWASFDSVTGLLSGTPQAANVGTTTGIVVSVSNGQQTVSLPAFNLPVVNEADYNHPPVIRNPQPPVKATVGQLYYYNPEGYDLDNDPLIYSIQNKPAWASFDPATGIVQGTPTANDVGLVVGMVVTVAEANTMRAGAVEASAAGSSQTITSNPTNLQTIDPNLGLTVSTFAVCSSGVKGYFEEQIMLTAVNLTLDEYYEFKLVDYTGVRVDRVAKKLIDSGQLYTVILPLEVHTDGLQDNTTTTGTYRIKLKGQILTFPIRAQLSQNCGQGTTSTATSSDPTLKLDRAQLDFAGALNSSVATKPLKIESTGNVLNWTTTTDQPWVTLSASSGQTSQTIQVGIDLNRIKIAGNYPAGLTITDQNGKQTKVAITVKVDPPPSVSAPASNLMCNNNGTVKLTAIEVTQGIQNLLNEIPLVKGRRTFVRIHVRSNTNAAIENFSAKLYNPTATGNQEIAAGIQDVTTANITVKVAPDRTVLADSLLFELPTDWVNKDSLTIQLRAAQGGTIQCDELLAPSRDTVKDGAITLPLVTVPNLPVQFYYGSSTFGGKTAQTTKEDIIKIAQLLKAYFPIADVNWSMYPPTTLGVDTTSAVTAWTNLYAKVKQASSPEIHHFAVFRLPDTYPYLGGGLGSQNTCSYYDANQKHISKDCRVAVAMIKGDSILDNLIGHEFVHTFGLGHIYNSPSANNPNETEKLDQRFPLYLWPKDHKDTYRTTKDYQDARPRTGNGYGPAEENENAAFYVLYTAAQLSDSRLPPVLLQPRGGDLVSISPNKTQYTTNAGITMSLFARYPSEFTYQYLITKLKEMYGNVTSAQSVGSQTESEITFVQGYITSTTSGRIEEALGVIGDGSLPASEPGDYSLRLERSNGTVVTTIPFGLPHPSDGEESSARFSVAVPYTLQGGSEISKIVLLYQNTVLDQLTANQAAPVIASINFANNSTTIDLTAVVNDTDPLSYQLEYSPDNGTTWLSVAAGNGIVPQAGQATVNISVNKADLPGSNGHQWRLFVNDGFFTTRSTQSQSFSIPNHPPTAYIFTDFSEHAVVGDQLLTFEGTGYDLEDGRLEGASLIWHASRDGVLGTGATLTISADDLSEGEQLFWLEAIDSNGQSSLISDPLLADVSASSQATAQADEDNSGLTAVTLLQVYRDQPYAAPNLAATGFNLALGKDETVTATLPIRNSGDGGALDWTVTATGLPNWIQLSQTSGKTPQNLVVTANASGVAPGTYTGTLTFQSSKAILNKTVTAPYTVEVLAVATPQQQSLFLPLIRR